MSRGKPQYGQNWLDGQRAGEVEQAQNASALEACLGHLFYQDGQQKELCHQLIKIIEDIKMTIGEVNALVIDGIMQFDIADKPAHFLIQAEEQGCVHPVLLYYMGQCFSRSDKGVTRCQTKAIAYFDKTIEVGSLLGYVGRYDVYAQGRIGIPAEAYRYLMDLELEGVINPWLAVKIGDGYRDGVIHSGDVNRATEYYQTAIQSGDVNRAIEYYQTAIQSGYVPAYLSLHLLLRDVSPEKAMLTLLEAEEKGLGQLDERVLKLVIEDLHELYYPSKKALGKFKDRGEMVLHYCDVLISRNSPIAYDKKGYTYWAGLAGVVESISTALELFNEGDQAGLLPVYAYTNLLSYAYTYGCKVARDFSKAYIYAERARSVAMNKEQLNDIDESMTYLSQQLTSNQTAWNW